jgi:hypothetical protein
VNEYLERKQLATMGIVSQARDVSAFKCDCFLLIHAEFDRLRENERKREREKAKKR